VKVRGFRIELGEIEARLTACEGVSEAVVIAREDVPGDKRLVAYYTAIPEAHVTVESLKSQLSRTLASYMVPAAYVRLSALPLTHNGKLDRKALPRPDGQAHVTREYEAPVGAVESGLAEIWSDVLSAKRVGRHDNFFELGGHSLLGMRLIVRAAESFSIPLPVIAIFRCPTISMLARMIEGLLAQSLKPFASNSAQLEEGVI
jgi:acyl carrier protein